jgi:YD repeat-containing protein
VTKSARFTNWRYGDLRGRLETETRTFSDIGGVTRSDTTTYSYDAADRLVTTRLPDNELLTTSYTDQGRPQTLSSSLNPGQFLANNAVYDVAGRPLTLQLPLGGNLTRRQGDFAWHQQGGRLRTVSVTGPGLPPVLGLAYTYDPVGNVQTLTEGGVTPAPFSYDERDRLTSAWGKRYTYDVLSRRTNYEGAGYTPDSLHVHAVDQVGGVDRYDYDANGNLTVRNKGLDNEQWLGWDAENRLSTVLQKGADDAMHAPAAAGTLTLTHRFFLPL